MKTFDEAKPKHAFVLAGALLFSSAFSTPIMAQETPATPYTMTVIKDAAYGNRVTAGRYEQAISRITRDGTRSRDRFADQVNLCVAYAKSKDLENANVACEAALASLKRQERRAARNKRSLVFRQYQSDLSVALSNRGVVLAVSGKPERAKEDFAAAIELQTSLSKIAEANLERLEQSVVPDA